MRNWEQDKPSRQKLVRLVAAEIEAIRLKRRRQWSEQQHPELKTFTQEELNSEVYGAYKNMILGRTSSLPSREQLLYLADYLECTVAERNDLLIAAQYLPEMVHLPEDQRRRAVEDLFQTLEYLHLPAYIADMGWTVLTANNQFLTMCGIDNLSILLGNHREHVVGMNCAFDPDAPTYPAMTLDSKTWRQNAVVTKAIWQRHNALFKYESWYASHLSKISRYPGFNDIWKAENYDLPGSQEDLTYVLVSDHTGWPITLRPVIISPFQVPYPMMLIFLPVDEHARGFIGRLSPVAPEPPEQNSVYPVLPSLASAR